MPEKYGNILVRHEDLHWSPGSKGLVEDPIHDDDDFNENACYDDDEDEDENEDEDTEMNTEKRRQQERKRYFKRALRLRTIAARPTMYLQS